MTFFDYYTLGDKLLIKLKRGESLENETTKVAVENLIKESGFNFAIVFDSKTETHKVYELENNFSFEHLMKNEDFRNIGGQSRKSKAVKAQNSRLK